MSHDDFVKECVINSLDALAFLLVTPDLYGKANLANIRNATLSFNPFAFWRTAFGKKVVGWTVGLAFLPMVVAVTLGAPASTLWALKTPGLPPATADLHVVANWLSKDLGRDLAGYGTILLAALVGAVALVVLVLLLTQAVILLGQIAGVILERLGKAFPNDGRMLRVGAGVFGVSRLLSVSWPWVAGHLLTYLGMHT